MSFSDLKKQSKLGSLTSKLVREVEKMNTTSGGDERLWKPEVDKSGNGYAVIRFLPAPEGEDIPWVKMYSHAFQGPGGWYMENSLTTLGSKDPVSEHNSQLWNSGSDANKEIARKQKRKLQYFANILVIKDSANPANEGKVMLYRFGKKIFDKCMEAMQPAFEDEKPVNPFDFWEGADFKLKIRKVDGYWNYDKSEFDKPSPIFKNDDEIEAVWKKQYPLAEFSAESNFKSYDELKKRLDTVLAGTTTVGNVTTLMEDEPVVSTATVDTKEEPAPTPTVTEDDEDDTMSYFEKLAEEG